VGAVRRGVVPARQLLDHNLAVDTSSFATAGTSRLFAAGAAALVLLAPVSVQAQTVTLFGVLDAALERVDKVAPSGTAVHRMPSLTGSVPSRLGFRGQEDIGGGWRAVFTVEQGLTPDMGTVSQGGRGYGRQAFVGLTGPAGQFSLGRQYTMLFWSILETDVMGPHLYGTGSLDAYIPNARVDNSIAWRGSFGPWTLGATYSLGRDAVNAGNPAGTNCAGEGEGGDRACREWSALLKWDRPGWGAAAAVDSIRGGAGAFAGLTSPALKDRRISVNGYVKSGSLKATLGLIRRDNDAPGAVAESDLWYAGLVYGVTPQLTLDGQWHRLDYQGSADGATLWAARATYSLSRRTAVYSTWGRIANEGRLALSVSAGAGGSAPRAGGAQQALAVGVRHAF
jgi:predicted porin